VPVVENTMTKFYFHPSPNPMKVALLLEELGVPFDLIAVDIFKGEQHGAGFRKLNPNGKVPVLVDEGVTVFDSHAILLHLAEKHGRFLPASGAARAAALSWLQLIATGLSPFSGQAVHFLHYAPESIAYAKNRYLKEVERHYAVLDARLAAATFLAGDEYTIADMALWGWARGAAYIFGDAGLSAYPNVARLVDGITKRPAAARAAALQSRLSLKQEFDEETKRALFPQNV
jgi:GST-like protein